MEPVIGGEDCKLGSCSLPKLILVTEQETWGDATSVHHDLRFKDLRLIKEHLDLVYHNLNLQVCHIGGNRSRLHKWSLLWSGKNQKPCHRAPWPNKLF